MHDIKLTQMNEWYADRFERYYDPHLEMKIIKSLIEKIDEEPHMRDYSLFAHLYFNKDAVVYRAQTHFSDMSLESQRILELIANGDTEMAELYGTVYNKVSEFAGHVTDGNVDSAFIKTFGSHRVLSDYEIKAGSAKLELFELLGHNPHKLALTRELWNAKKDLVYMINQEVFNITE